MIEDRIAKVATSMTKYLGKEFNDHDGKWEPYHNWTLTLNALRQANPDLDQMMTDDPQFGHSLLDAIRHGDDDTRDDRGVFFVDAYRKVLSLNPGVGNRVGRILQENIYEDMEARMDKIMSVLDFKKPVRRIDVSQYVHSQRNDRTIYDFCSVTDALEEAYDIDFRDIYGGIRKRNEYKIMTEVLGLTQDQIEQGCKIAPIQGDIAALAFYVLNAYTRDVAFAVKALPVYIDHWHYLMSADFEGFSNGGIRTMSTAPWENESPVFAQIRAIYAHECAKPNDKEIWFCISW